LHDPAHLEQSGNERFKVRSESLDSGLGTHLFVKVPRPGDSEVTFFGLQVKLPPVTTSSKYSKVGAITLSALPKDTTSELAGLSPH